jgi:hypothetical protein
VSRLCADSARCQSTRQETRAIVNTKMNVLITTIEASQSGTLSIFFSARITLTNAIGSAPWRQNSALGHRPSMSLGMSRGSQRGEQHEAERFTEFDDRTEVVVGKFSIQSIEKTPCQQSKKRQRKRDPQSSAAEIINRESQCK